MSAMVICLQEMQRGRCCEERLVNDLEALAAMAAFLPRLTQPPAKFGTFNMPERRPDGTLSMPYWTHAELVADFVDMAS